MTPETANQAAYGRARTQETAATRGKANNARGKRAERTFVTWLRDHGWPGAERTVRTGHRVPGRVSVDKGDIDGTPGLCWQIKDTQEREWWKIPAWLDDVEMQRCAAGADLGILVVKRRGHADPGHWWAWLMLGDLVQDYLESGLDPRPTLYVPVRLAVADLATVLRHAGFGTPIEVTA